MKIRVTRFETVGSTNDEVLDLAKRGAPEGTCVVAGAQSSGRGRQGRVWHSERGSGVYLSILLRPQIDVLKFPVLTLVCAVALHDSIFELCGVRPDIKWPNDILVGKKKICGMLAETCETRDGPAAVIGIGVNLSTESLPPEIKENSTSLSDLLGRTANFEIALRSILANVTTRYSDFADTGDVAGILTEWSSRSSYDKGKLVMVRTGNQTIRGETAGIDDTGSLLIKTETGEVVTVAAGDVEAVRPGTLDGRMGR